MPLTWMKSFYTNHLIRPSLVSSRLRVAIITSSGPAGQPGNLEAPSCLFAPSPNSSN